MSTRSISRAHEAKRDRRLRARSKVAVGAGTALCAVVLLAPGAQAATFTVTNLDDSGPGSLRQAIEVDANGTPGADAVVFESGLSGTIVLTSGEIPINDAVDVQGPGSDLITVSGNDASRVFHVDTADLDPVTISGLTLTGGNDPNDDVDGGGAVMSRGAALTISDAVLSSNFSADSGGALFTRSGTLEVRRATLTDNETNDIGGAIAIFDTQSPLERDVLISESTISGNRAPLGEAGGISLRSVDGAAVIEKTTISGNAAAAGGGIFVRPFEQHAPLIIAATTISANTADLGGGINIDRTDSPVRLENTTVSGNTAQAGGGIYVTGDSDDLDGITLRNSTVAANQASESGGGIYRAAGDGDRVKLCSTIVADNAAPANPDLGQGGPMSESFTMGLSLVEDTGNATVTLASTEVGLGITGADPRLGPLASNGGPTQTHLPALSSRAINQGVSHELISQGVPHEFQTDQRGLPRVQGAPGPEAKGSDGTDIGSVEVQAANCHGSIVPTIGGTSGDDELIGDRGRDLISGLRGNDLLNGLGADDCLYGDEGKDVVKGGGGEDLERGGGGQDKLRGQGGKDGLKGGGGNDELVGGEGKDKIGGQGGKDKLRGQGGKDRFNGGGGKDKVSGGAGKDRLKGGPGKDKLKGDGGSDRLNAVDGKRDNVNCGGGNKDKATVDAEDSVSANCETVVEHAGGSGGARPLKRGVQLKRGFCILVRRAS